MKMGFCYQKDIKKTPVATCGRQDFWREVRSQQTQWHIDTRRAVKAAVKADLDGEGAAAIQNWLQNTDYQKFLIRKPRSLNSKEAKEAFARKTDEEKLLAWAEELKQELTAFVFSCYLFDKGRFRQKNKKTGQQREVVERRRQLKLCHLNGLVMLDIDHVDNPMQIWWKLREMKPLMQRVVLVHISCSGDGIRVIFTADAAIGNLADNQIEFARALGHVADDSCIDATRTSFAPKEEDILYIDEERLFTYYDEEFDKLYTPRYREGHTQPEHHEAFADRGHRRRGCAKNDAVADAETPSGPGAGGTVDVQEAVSDGGETDLSWCGHDLQPVCDQWTARRFDNARRQGSRHEASIVLARDLYILYDRDRRKTLQMLRAQPWVQEIIRERDEDVERTVEDAANYVAAQESETARKGKPWLPKPSAEMLEAIRLTLPGLPEGEECLEGSVGGSPSSPLGRLGGVNSSPSGRSGEVEIPLLLQDWGAQIEAMMDDFPILRDICKGLKPNQFAAALFVAGALLMTLMTRCWYRFYHRPEEQRRLNNSTLIIGDPASGKSFATRLFKLLAAPIVAADKKGKEAINAYREEMKTKGANKEKPKKPRVIVRVHPARTSNAQFIQDMVNAVETVDGEEMQLHMLTFDTELDNTVSVQKGGSWIDKFSMELKAFHNEEDGQAYSNLDSVFQDFIVTWNFIYTGTPIALKKKVNEQNFGSGLATRLTCIPLPSTNFEMMEKTSRVDFESDGRLKAWAFKLDRTKGELPVQKLVDELYDWTARRMEDAKENDSKADEMLLKRCAYHGLNFAAPFIVMRHWEQLRQDGDFWCGAFETDEVDWKLAELIVNIQYACQRHYFGAMAEAYFDNKHREAAVNVQRRQKTIEAFSRLPEEFTVEDVERCFSLSHSAARSRAFRLLKDHLAEKSGEYTENGTVKARYRKTGIMML